MSGQDNSEVENMPTTSDEDAKMIAELREISEAEGKEIVIGIAIVVALVILWWIVVVILFGGGWA
jgi:hypothetical protein